MFGFTRRSAAADDSSSGRRLRQQGQDGEGGRSSRHARLAVIVTRTFHFDHGRCRRSQLLLLPNWRLIRQFHPQEYFSTFPRLKFIVFCTVQTLDDICTLTTRQHAHTEKYFVSEDKDDLNFWRKKKIVTKYLKNKKQKAINRPRDRDLTRSAASSQLTVCRGGPAALYGRLAAKLPTVDGAVPAGDQ